MNTIRIPKRFTNNVCESLLEQLGNTSEQIIDVQLPQSLAFGGSLSSEARLIQFLISVRRKSKFLQFSTYKSPRSMDEQLDDLSGHAYGLVAFYLADNFRFDAGELADRRYLLQHVSPYLKAADSGDFARTGKGIAANLLMLQGARSEYLRPLYKGNSPKLRDASSIELAIKNILLFLAQNKTEKHLLEFLTSDLSLSLRELVENIDDHASQSLDKSRINRNARGALFRYHRINAHKLSYETELDGPMASFAGGTASRSLLKGKRDTPLLEMSIFDSGFGIPCRWFGRASDEIPFADQVKYTKRSFLEGETTKKSGDAAGYGLFRLQQVAKRLHGLIEIRTCKVNIWRTFRPEDDLEGQLSWMGEHSEMNDISGTRVSLIAPVI
ncbi:hypothetical protein [Salinisphaera hydrothermalis]|uniref:hypothetical protein n=1 Tax=Salinisphaera hydrothermalis TaxID=563188 RepID=UPI0012EBE802|nr:hypothetical protein [Salinisphaera hydrothermalis]